MKKLVSVLISAALCFGLCIPSSAAQASNLDDLLAPYQAAIKQVNAETGSSFFIPTGNKQQVYNSIKNKTPAEFASMLEDEYKNYSVNTSTSSQTQTGYKIYDTINVLSD
jgi:hypothetical protein